MRRGQAPVLITGAAGGLGRAFARLLPSALALTRAQLPIEDGEAVRRALEEARPRLLFNCAAYNAVDAAESSPHLALAANAKGPGVLAAACLEAGVRMVHFSTNYVFPGTSSLPYTEQDPPAPLSTYGRSKLAGEKAVLEALPGALVIRSSGLFGPGGSAVKGGTFPERIIERARAGGPLTVVDDQRLNPTFTEDLAEGALALAEAGTAGLVHLVAEGCCTWLEFAREALAAAGVECPVEGISTASLRSAAARPAFGCLASLRVDPLRGWRDALWSWLGPGAAALR